MSVQQQRMAAVGQVSPIRARDTDLTTQGAKPMDDAQLTHTEAPHGLLLDRYRALPGGQRQREAAAALGVSEGALVAAFATAPSDKAGVPRVRPLRSDWDALMGALPSLGEVMALTRNAHAVIEKEGVYGGYERFGLMANVIGQVIDLRLFLRAWHAAFAVEQVTGRGINPSIQVFNRAGEAVHKIFVGVGKDTAPFEALVAQLAASASEMPTFETPASDAPREGSAHGTPAPASTHETAEPETSALLKRASLLDAWSTLKDTHDFFPMIHRLKLDRYAAVRLAEGIYTRQVARDAYASVLEGAAAQGLSIMVFVSSGGVVEIHTGPVEKVKRLGTWFNVMDKGFNLHLDEQGIHASWVVTKPTVDGDVTSLEVYDAAGELVVQFFGERKPGRPESEPWRALLATLGAAH